MRERERERERGGRAQGVRVKGSPPPPPPIQGAAGESGGGRAEGLGVRHYPLNSPQQRDRAPAATSRALLFRITSISAHLEGYRPAVTSP